MMRKSMGTLLTTAFTTLALLSVSAISAGQHDGRTLHKAPAKNWKFATPVAFAQSDGHGHVVGPVYAYQPELASRNASLWVTAFDATNTKPSALPLAAAVHSGFYGADNGLLDLGDDYITRPTSDDVNLNSATAFRNAQLVTACFVWNPSGSIPASGTANLALEVKSAQYAGIWDSLDPYSNPMGGAILYYSSLAAGHYTSVGNLAGTGIGISLPQAASGAYVVTPYTFATVGGPASGLATTAAFQIALNNMNSTTDATFAGTNVSSSDANFWQDDSNPTDGFLLNKPDYIFQTLTNTSALASPFSEHYSGDYTVTSQGIMHPAVGLFVDDNARVIKGSIVFNSCTAGQEPTNVIIKVKAGSTTYSITKVLGSGSSFEILDPTTTGGPRTVSVQAGTWLRQNKSVDTTAGSVSNVVFSLINGDCDGNGIVNINDYSLLSDHFNAPSGDPNYLAVADLDRNGTININDYAILSDNFNLVGDPNI